MLSPNGSLRQRAGKEKAKVNGKVDQAEEYLDIVIKSTKQNVKQEWDYKVALGVITALSFLTRFWGISHPNEVVFDEVHFGKVEDI
jgi:dolichyl-phosphate-mannose-protein mannosyltransferase